MITEFFDETDETALIEVLSDEAVEYCGKTINAVVDYGLDQSFSQDSYGIFKGITILALKKDCPNVKRGSEFKHKGKKLTVDRVIQDTEMHIYAAVICA